jgi:hypothetical protein
MDLQKKNFKRSSSQIYNFLVFGNYTRQQDTVCDRLINFKKIHVHRSLQKFYKLLFYKNIVIIYALCTYVCRTAKVSINYIRLCVNTRYLLLFFINFSSEFSFRCLQSESHFPGTLFYDHRYFDHL